MAENFQNTTNVGTNISSKPALVTDLNDSYISNEQYSHARNVVRNSKEGDMGTMGNEPSTVSCYSAPYQIIGIIPMHNDQDLVFSTDNVNSEIGIGDRKTCTYTKKLNLACLNFSTKHLITGVAKKHSKKGVIATFTDKYNPVRRIELNKLEKVQDCDDILLFKKITHPSISVKKGSVGNMPNGMYSVVIAYSVDGKPFSDWYSITNRESLFSKTGSNSLEVTVGNLDREFEKYVVAVVGNYIDPDTKGVTKAARVIGEFSTKQTKFSVSDYINSNYEEIKLSELVLQKRTWQKAGIISSNSNYLILGDLVARQEENYQLKAFQIETEYVVTQVPVDYYTTDGQDVGYYRDENYDFYIQGVTATGELTDKFQIPGPVAKAADLGMVTGPDVYEYDTQFNDCEEPGKIPSWKVRNTAGAMIPYNEEFKCDRRLIGRGKTGYHASTDLYPDNPALFGEWANTPIRYHRMPDETKVPRYSVIKGKTYINILGVRFKNIPKFDSPDIVGYKITRSDRKGGNGTVVARGIMTNVRSYTDKQTDTKVMYSNYTVNDLNPDVYLSNTQTVYKNGKETNFEPLTDYHKDRFSFYSPHTLFEPRYSLGSELKIESEEVADITGNFEIVHNHPKLKLLNQFSFWLALAIGIVETYFESQGMKNQMSYDTSGKITGTATTTGTSNGTINFGAGTGGVVGGTKINTSSNGKVGGTALSITGDATKDLITELSSLIRTGNFANLKTYIKTLKLVLKLILNMGVAAGLTTISVMRYAQEILDIINRFTGDTNYVYQYNSHAKFVTSIPVQEGNKRRRLLRDAVYIPSEVITIGDEMYNNWLREKCVYLHLNKAIKDPINKDTSRNTISGFGLEGHPTDKTKSIGSAFYATSKVVNPNQYGPLGSSSPVAMHSPVLTFGENTTESPVLFGGDCVISRFYLQKKMQFFNQNLANANFADGMEYDYRLYRNIAYPRFWLDTTRYDYGELLKKKQINFATFNRTTASRHNLDCKKSKDGDSPTRIDDAYMYLSNNCALEFITEADYNPEFREETNEPFYSKDNTNLKEIFRSDRLEKDEEFNISRAFSDLYTTEIYANMQRDDFDPANPIPVEQPNSVIYSLPAFNLQEVDNWQYFLPNNFFAFSESDFGNLTSIHKLDQDRIIYLFSKSSPYVSMGRDMLQLEGGRKVTIGDGGMFAQDPREVMPTDNNYGACNSRYAFSNTHMGRFYPSENQGRIFSFTEGLDDISRMGMSFWCKNYMPIFLYKYFPNYPQVENPVDGVGYLTAFDSFYETCYITKRDYAPKREYVKDLVYDAEKGFLYKGSPVSLNSTYFNDISWTISYSVIDKSFISWHDWHPDLTVQTDNHFMSVKGNTVYKHNETYESFCNFYGKDYPFEIEFLSASGQQVETIRSLEYFLEAYKYKNFGRDRYHVKDENFDRLIVHNSEQISPVLNLVEAPENPRNRLYYPHKSTLNNVSYNILFEKVEQKYRINQFWDTTRDRNADVHLMATDESGYKKVINPLAINIDRPEMERKAFRHNWNKFLFMKTVSGPIKFLTKIVNIKKLISPR